MHYVYVATSKYYPCGKSNHRELDVPVVCGWELHFCRINPKISHVASNVTAVAYKEICGLYKEIDNDRNMRLEVIDSFMNDGFQAVTVKDYVEMVWRHSRVHEAAIQECGTVLTG